MEKQYIYFLHDPTWTSDKFYIGKTISLQKRLLGHLTPNKLKSKSTKNSWIKSLLKKNIKPQIFLICEISDNVTWEEAETQWITFLKWCGVKLVNGTYGGEGRSGHKMPENVKNALLMANVGKPTHNKGKKLSIETRAKISLNHADINGNKNPMYNKKHSDVTKEKMSKAKLGKNASRYRHDVDNNYLIKRYNEGANFRQIGMEVNLFPNLIKMRLLNEGIVLRSIKKMPNA